jgi:hypothetical protein
MHRHVQLAVCPSVYMSAGMDSRTTEEAFIKNAVGDIIKCATYQQFLKLDHNKLTFTRRSMCFFARSGRRSLNISGAKNIYEHKS